MAMVWLIRNEFFTIVGSDWDKTRLRLNEQNKKKKLLKLKRKKM